MYATIGCLALAAALTAAAPPVPTRSGTELAEQARRELDSISAVQLRMTSPGFSLRLSLDEDGNCAGSAAMTDHGRVKIVKRGETVWLAPNAAFWRTQVGGEDGEKLANSVNGRYIKGTSDQALMEGMSATCDLDVLRTAAFAGDGSQWRRGTGAAGHHLTRTQGDTTVTMDVAPHGRPYPRTVTRETPGAGQDVLRLSRFGAPVPRGVPSERDSLDTAELTELLDSPPTESV